MFLSYLVIVIHVSANMVLIQSHDCNIRDLLASDLSLIDMMKYCLNTCIKPATSAAGVTYVRWGKKGCSEVVDMVYTGQVGGNSYSNKGGGVNYLCLPNHPENGKILSRDNDQLFGAEYQTGSYHKPSEMTSDLFNKEVPCAVCYQRKRSTVLMIPGRQTCYKGWTFLYTGYIMSDYKDYSSKEYVCVDKDAEAVDNKTGDENGALFYGVKTKCGSLRCPPYTDVVDVHCVVCTK